MNEGLVKAQARAGISWGSRMAAPTGTAKMHGRAALLGVVFMLLAATLNACDAIIVRLLAQQVHPFVIAFFRSLFGLIVVLPWILRRRAMLKSSYSLLHVVRAALKLVSLVAYFAAFAAAPLADVTAIMFTAPIFLTLGAVVFLGERLTLPRLLAVLAGFIGVLFVIRPGQGGISPALVYALIGAAVTAGIQLILKRMSGRDSAETLVAWNLIAMVPLALIPALVFWTQPTPAQLGLLAIQGVIGALNMMLITRALGLADASFLAPLDFVRLPAVAILAFVFFGEVASIETWVGAGVIFAATLIVAGSARWSRGRDIAP